MKSDVSTGYPLAVDLDGTLLRVDSLIEIFIVNLLRQPWTTLKALPELLHGRGTFKSKRSRDHLVPDVI
jgi:hypothetical protein